MRHRPRGNKWRHYVRLELKSGTTIEFFRARRKGVSTSVTELRFDSGAWSPKVSLQWSVKHG